ncbi:MAG: chloride channel protein [Candidatus Bathyarchaeia archaeon]
MRSLIVRIPKWGVVNALAVLAGVFGGLGAVFFRRSLDFFGFLFQNILNFSSSLGFGVIGVVLLPAMGGLIVGIIVLAFAQETKGHGVPEVIESVNLKGGHIRPRVALVKIIVSSITISSGGSAGREGPIAQIGATIGSTIGKIARIGREGTKLIVMSGLAAGIGGTFNAPLGGAIFAIEVINPTIDPRRIIPVFLASVVGTSVAEIFLGTRPAFSAPSFTIPNPVELALFIPLGIAFGLVSVAWVWAFYKVEDLFDKLKLSRRLKPALGGFVTGTIGVFAIGYGIMGVGYEGIELAAYGQITILLLLSLGIAKIVTTSFTIGSGGSGGIFAPSLFIGMMFGSVFGNIYNQFIPTLAEQPFVYGIAGMGALFAGVAKAPITSIVIVAEMFDNSHLLPPLMISASISYFVSSLLMKDSIYSRKLERRGVHIQYPRAQMQAVSVSEVMTPVEKVVKADEHVPVAIISEYFWKYGHNGYPVMTEGTLLGIITLSDVKQVAPGRRNETKIGEIATRKLIIAYPEDTVLDALEKMTHNDVGRLPVVQRSDQTKLVGIITRKDVIRAQRTAELG